MNQSRVQRKKTNKTCENSDNYLHMENDFQAQTCFNCKSGAETLLKFTSKIECFSSFFSDCGHKLCQSCFLNQINTMFEKSLQGKKDKSIFKNALNCSFPKCHGKILMTEYIKIILDLSDDIKKVVSDLQDLSIRQNTQLSENFSQSQLKIENEMLSVEKSLQTIDSHIFSGCKRCKKPQPYICGMCINSDLEEAAKINFYSKQKKLEELLQRDYESESYKNFMKELEMQEMTCPVCKDFNQFPVIVCMTGHELCIECLMNIRQNQDAIQACPLCKAELLNVTPNSLRANQIIQKLQIECPKCQLQVGYPEFVQHHYRNCKIGDQFKSFQKGIERKIECQFCLKPVELLFYDIHLSNFCPDRQCPFNCDRLMKDHENMLVEHLIQAMKRSDIAYTFNLRMNIVEKFLFHGSFGICSQCDYQYAWKLDNRGANDAFCFKCFRLT